MNKLAIFVIILASISAILIACGGAATSAPEAIEEAKAPEAMAPTTAPAVKEPAAEQAMLTALSVFSTEQIQVARPVKFGESPVSAALVAAGQLPPVADRLPDEPLVVVVNEIGQYGGIFKRLQTSVGDMSSNAGRITSHGMIRSSGSGLGYVPQTIRSFTPNEDASVWTVKLLKGLKWSDGAPLTADDYLYAHEILTDSSVYPRLPKHIIEAGEPLLQVVKIDDYTVEMRFPRTNWLAETVMFYSSTRSNLPYIPGHYYKQFNANYNDDAQKNAEAEGFETWEKYYTSLDSPVENPDRPFSGAWVWDDPRSEDIVRFSRNHYYGYVDQEGNQLPYIEYLKFGPIAGGTDAVALAAVQGDLDLQGRHLKIEAFPLLKAGEEKGGYTVRFIGDPNGTDLSLTSNLTYNGPEGVLIKNKDWRIAMSYAIDRESISEGYFLGESLPRNSLPAADHPFYPGAEYERKFGTYEPERANAMLDDLMGPRDSEGFRTLPNGDRFEFVISARDAYAAMAAGAELLCRDYQDVGVRCTPEVLGGSLLSQRGKDNEIMARTTWAMGAADVYVYSGVTLPIGAGGTWGAEWGKWYASKGAEGEEPPAEVRNLYDLFANAGLTKDAGVTNAQEIHKWIVDNKVMTGVVGGIGSYGMVVIDNDLANVPDWYANRVTINTPNTAFPDQFWFRSEERRAQAPR